MTFDVCREQKDITSAATAALAPLGLAIAPGPAAAAGAPEAAPGSAIAGQPSIECPSAQGPTADLALVSGSLCHKDPWLVFLLLQWSSNVSRENDRSAAGGAEQCSAPYIIWGFKSELTRK